MTTLRNRSGSGRVGQAYGLCEPKDSPRASLAIAARYPGRRRIAAAAKLGEQLVTNTQDVWEEAGGPGPVAGSGGGAAGPVVVGEVAILPSRASRSASRPPAPAARLEAYNRIIGDKGLEVEASIIKGRAIHKAGLLSGDLEKAEYDRGHGTVVPSGGKYKADALAEAGISTSGSNSRYQPLPGGFPAMSRFAPSPQGRNIVASAPCSAAPHTQNWSAIQPQAPSARAVKFTSRTHSTDSHTAWLATCTAPE